MDNLIICLTKKIKDCYFSFRKLLLNDWMIILQVGKQWVIMCKCVPENTYKRYYLSNVIVFLLGTIQICTRWYIQVQEFLVRTFNNLGMNRNIVGNRSVVTQGKIVQRIIVCNKCVMQYFLTAWNIALFKIHIL